MSKSSVAIQIQNEIALHGAISFARFMELALYAPGAGYYEKLEQVGKAGDFITSVSVGTLFGELLAYQFAEWFSELVCESESSDQPAATFELIEAGAHDGKLALDILTWLRANRPELFKRLEYLIVEPSASRQAWQRKTLENFGNVRWENDLAGDSLANSVPAIRIIFSNELFDAMPVHRFGWNSKTKTWFEWAVGWSGENFIWERAEENQVSPANFRVIDRALLDILPDNFTTEICPAAAQWWTQAAKCINRGKLVAIDYGLLQEEFFVPERTSGTLRAISRHHANADLLSAPGEQDITAHVNFSELKLAGERASLKTETLSSQAQFLMSILEKGLKNGAAFNDWDAARRRQFQTLTHPEHFGRAFRVLVQSR